MDDEEEKAIGQRPVVPTGKIWFWILEVNKRGRDDRSSRKRGKD